MRQLIRALTLVSLISLANPPAVASDNEDYSGPICGTASIAAFWSSQFMRERIVAGALAGFACVIVYEVILSIRKDTGYASLSPEQAHLAIINNITLSSAALIFGERPVAKILGLPKDQQTESNINEILEKALGLAGDPPET